MSKKNKYIVIFLVLNVLQLICWLFSLGPLTSWQSGPIDAQSGLFFITLIGIYLFVFLSLFFLVFFIIQFYKLKKYLIIGLLLNIHVFILVGKYINDLFINKK